MKPLTAVGFAVLGASLIAVSYGLARFAFGLFVPLIRDDLGLNSEILGAVGALAFVSYALAIALAPLVVDRVGARGTAVVAGTFAALGLAVIGHAGSAWVLAAGVLACGVSTGLISPAMAAAVECIVKPRMRGRVNAIINAGTSVGVAASVPTLVWLSGAWRSAYQLFAVAAVVSLIAAWAIMPARGRVSAKAAACRPPIAHGQWRDILGIGLFAFATGVVSAAYWIFAPDLVVALGGLSPGQTGLLWIAVGIGGAGGAVAGDLVGRHGFAMTHGFALATLAASLALIAASPGELALALMSAAFFGAAYITLTAVYLIGGISILPGRPALGPVLPFLALALGQVVGSPLSGFAIATFGHADAFSSFAALGLLVALHSPLLPGRRTGGAHGPVSVLC